MRCAILAVAAVALASAANAKPPTQSANERAYTVTLMCAMVAVTGTNESDKVRAIEAARKMAKANGYPIDRLSKDLLTMAKVAGVELRNNPNALDEDRRTCRKLGLVE